MHDRVGLDRDERRQLPPQAEQKVNRNIVLKSSYDLKPTLAREDTFPSQLARTLSLHNGARWYNFSPPRWSIIAPPLTAMSYTQGIHYHCVVPDAQCRSVATIRPRGAAMDCTEIFRVEMLASRGGVGLARQCGECNGEDEIQVKQYTTGNYV